jgi:hypothetical protein
MPRSFNQVHPHQAIAVCTPEQAKELVSYDHHTVLVQDRLGVLLTSAWMPIEAHAGPFVLTVVFQYADRHPRAPEAIQAIVDTLKFRLRGQPR